MQSAVAAGIPIVLLNSGVNQALGFGALMAIGQAESLAGEQAGRPARQGGRQTRHVRCPRTGQPLRRSRL